jgi:membrane protein YqaA with SNARE-associated domain
VKFVEFLNWLQNTDQGIVLFVMSFANAVFLPVGPELFFIPSLVLGPSKLIPYASYCVFGSVLGLMVTFTVAYNYSQVLVEKHISAEKIEKGVAIFTKYGPWSLIIAAMFPMFPIRTLVIISGCLKQRPLTILSLLTIGKTLRFFGYGFLIAKLGESVLKYIK